jgi:hypothetical protein
MASLFPSSDPPSTFGEGFFLHPGLASKVAIAKIPIRDNRRNRPTYDAKANDDLSTDSPLAVHIHGLVKTRAELVPKGVPIKR